MLSGCPCPWSRIVNRLIDILLLGLAGGVGTLLRAGCHTLAVRLFGHTFPWGTLAVNVSGAFAFGALYALIRSRTVFTSTHETMLLVGLLGGFTTYSSFAFQSVEMLAAGRTSAALTYILGTNVIALTAAWAGLKVCGG
jgi:CrcB protein